MVNPVTVNTALIVPLTGADVDTWGEDDVNPNMVAIDGMFAGAQTISVSSSNVTLTAPAGFTPTPGAGPTQSQNRLLRFTGEKTANVTVTLPIPGAYLIDNQTTGDFVLSFRGVTATEVVGTPNGEMVEIFNDGARVRFANLGFIGKMELWAGITSMPAWVAACTKVPYLICDGSTFSFSTYPYLRDILGGNFGGNGSTTGATPDMRGRVPLAYDSSGVRITAAGCGITGTAMGSAGGAQNYTMARANLPSLNFTVAAGQTVSVTTQSTGGAGTAGAGSTGISLNTANSVTTIQSTGNGTVTSQGTAASGGSGTPITTVQPSIVTGIWVIRAG